MSLQKGTRVYTIGIPRMAGCKIETIGPKTPIIMLHAHFLQVGDTTLQVIYKIRVCYKNKIKINKYSLAIFHI